MGLALSSISFRRESRRYFSFKDALGGVLFIRSDEGVTDEGFDTFEAAPKLRPPNNTLFFL